jgi:histidinol-phosphate aminotransferase
MDPLRHIKPAVRSLKAYQLVGQSARIKINQNENPHDIPATIKRRVVERAMRRPWSRYPSITATDLTTALSAHTGWRRDGILAGNGSNELLEGLLRVTVGPGTPVVIPEPTFSLYAMLTTILGGEPVRVPLDADLQYDALALQAARRRVSAPVTIVCSPNNPTGGLLAADDVEGLCQQGDGLVVVDEAYHEFAGETVQPLLESHRNLVVVRTFSKARALAGLRIGYLMADPLLVTEVSKARLPYSLNFFSELYAMAALEEARSLDAAVQELVVGRERLIAALDALPGLRALPSRTNFFLVELLSADPAAVFQALREREILVRDVTGYPRLERCLRISVGTEAENQALLEAFREILEAGPEAREEA